MLFFEKEMPAKNINGAVINGLGFSGGLVLTIVSAKKATKMLALEKAACIMYL